MRLLAVFLALGIALGLLSLAGSATKARASGLFAKTWNSGLEPSEPAFQVQAIDANTMAIRQSIRATFEAPFIYLLLGNNKALLIDTGVDTEGKGSLRAEVDRLIAARLGAIKARTLELVVMHSHGHADHVGGDPAFRGRDNTVVVGHAATDVARFFGIKNWPTDTAIFDLGGRDVEIVPTPGHHDSHVMVFDPATKVLFSGDTIYPGRIYFRCEKATELKASFDRIAALAARRQVQWVLGGHIEMAGAPGQLFAAEDRARRDEHPLELPLGIIDNIRRALAPIAARPRVTVHDHFVLFPHPADPRGKQPPDWCMN